MANTPIDLAAFQAQIQANMAQQQAARAAASKITDHLKSQLVAQAQQYGFNWKGNYNADYHTGLVAGHLAEQGVTDLSQVAYDKNQDLVNTATGKPIQWYKGTKGEIGWGAKGEGRTNYMVKPDANGKPVFYPQWKSNAPGGVGGFLLDVAPAIVGAFNPLAGAALSATEGALGGQSLGDIIKGAGTSYLAGQAGQYAGGATSGLGEFGSKTVGGMASGATRAGLSGQDILGGALRGGAIAGLTDLGMQGYRALTGTTGEGSDQSTGSKLGSALASGLIGTGVNALFAPSYGGGNRSQTVAPQATGGYTPQQVSTVSTQGVSAYSPAGDIESQSTGRPRQNVWNEASLRNGLGI